MPQPESRQCFSLVPLLLLCLARKSRQRFFAHDIFKRIFIRFNSHRHTHKIYIYCNNRLKSLDTYIYSGMLYLFTQLVLSIWIMYTGRGGTGSGNKEIAIDLLSSWTLRMHAEHVAEHCALAINRIVLIGLIKFRQLKAVCRLPSATAAILLETVRELRLRDGEWGLNWT